MTENEISKIIIGKAIEVHRHLGPGLLESAYQKCLAYDLRNVKEFYLELEKPSALPEKSLKTTALPDGKALITTKNL